VALQEVRLDLGETDAGQSGWCADEGSAHDVGGEADRLENLGAAVAHRGRDAHLRDDLEEAFLECTQVV
jgi:hypothetical protein